MVYGLQASAGNFLHNRTPELVVGLGLLDGNPAIVKILDPNGRELNEFIVYTACGCAANFCLGDVDGDGFEEIITGPGPLPVHPSHIRVFNSDLTVKLEFCAYPVYGHKTLMIDEERIKFPLTKYYHGLNIAAGDVNGDGLDEIITGLGPGKDYPPEVSIFNGKTGELIHRFLAY
jgi:hypothetical protein